MSTLKYPYPPTDIIGTVDEQGNVHISRAFADLLRGIEDTSGRVAANLDPNTATVADVVNAMITAEQMKAS